MKTKRKQNPLAEKSPTFPESRALKTRPLEVLSDPSLDNRTIEIGEATKIYQMEKVEGGSGTVVSSGQNQSVKNANAGYHYENKEIAIGDLKSGDKISVLSENNIRDQKNIQAKVVFLLPLATQKN